MDKPKISVIVPIYKVEPYLRRCLDSIVEQTYRNLEIILVDDGSPDNCGRICDEYATRDERIKVIHQLNAGLSFARNVGLAQATGDYIGFVDSDDWLELDFFEYLLSGVKRTGAKIVMCSFVMEGGQRSQVIGYSEEQLMDQRTAMGELLQGTKMTTSVWNKLYCREVYENIRFPNGKVYEDLATTYQVYEKANQVLALPKGKYHYRRNSQGIMMSKSVKNQLDYWAAAKDRFEALESKYPEYRELLASGMMGAATAMWSRIWMNRKELDKELQTVMKEMVVFSEEHWRETLRLGTFGITGKLRILLTRYQRGWAFWMAYQLQRLYEMKHTA